MTDTSNTKLARRRFLIRLGAGVGASAVTLPGAAQVITGSEGVGFDDRPRTFTDPEAGLKRRVSGFQAHRPSDYFSSLRNGAVLVDTDARALHFWDETGTIYKIYPTSVPLTEDLTRRGRTQVVRKRVGPDWRPTPNMLRRDPTLPNYVGPGPQNPLGTHALYLSWKYYRIHGTNDVRKIGRRSSNGCIGLYNEQIEELFGMCKVGTQVFVI